MIRDELKAALIAAMKGGDKPGVATIRMIQSAVKNRDIELRTGTAPADDDLLITEVMQKMIKQRRELEALYRQGGRPELAEAEASRNRDHRAVFAPADERGRSQSGGRGGDRRTGRHRA